MSPGGVKDSATNRLYGSFTPSKDFLVSFHRTYSEAFNAACELARTTRHDVGLEKTKDLNGKSGFHIWTVPGVGFRYGFEARCEVVTPTTPKMAVAS